MSARGVNEKQRSWLAGELNHWQSQGLVSSEQAGKILGLYETQEDLAEKRRSKAMLVLMAGAALLSGFGVLLLVGYNWQEIPKAAKLVMIFGCILGTHLGALRLRSTRGPGIASETAFFFGCLLYGAGIALVAQIFHLNAHYPDGLWWWALGTMPFAMALRTPLLHALLAGLLAIWCGTEVLDDPSRPPWWTRNEMFIPNGAFTLPLLLTPGLAWAYAKRSVPAVACYVAVLAWWMFLQPIAWRMDWETVFVLGAIGGLLLSIAGLHAPADPMAAPYRAIGTLLVAGVLIPLSFHEFLDDFARETDRLDLVGVLVLAGFAVVVSLLVVGKVARQRRTRTAGSWMELAQGQWFPVSVMLFMLLARALSSVHGGAVPAALLTNAAMVAMAFWMAQTGLHEDRGKRFGAGVVYFLLWSILRYVDLFGEMGGMLGASAMFFLCGAMLFVMALRWRRRKRWQHG